MLKISECHCKIKRIVQILQIIFRHILKAVKNLYILRLRKNIYQSFRFLNSCFSGIYRIDAVVFYSFKFLIRYGSFNYIGSSGTDDRLGIFIQKLNTLYCRICSLVKLTRQIFYRKNSGILCGFKAFLIKLVYRRLCKYCPAGFFKHLVRNILHIITNQHSYTCNRFDSQVTADFMFQFFCLNCIGRFLFYINTSYVAHERLLSRSGQGP